MISSVKQDEDGLKREQYKVRNKSSEGHTIINVIRSAKTGQGCCKTCTTLTRVELKNEHEPE